MQLTHALTPVLPLKILTSLSCIGSCLVPRRPLRLDAGSRTGGDWVGRLSLERCLMNQSARLTWVTAACLAPALLAAQEAAEKSEPGDLMSRVAHTLHVNPSSPQASDENAGTDDQPLQTITRAAQLAARENEEGAGTRILIHPGVYRERIRLRPAGKGTDAPIVFEATEPRKAVISGSEVWPGWTRQEETDVYVHDWPFRWGPAKAPAPLEGLAALHPILLRREMLFAN